MNGRKVIVTEWYKTDDNELNEIIFHENEVCDFIHGNQDSFMIRNRSHKTGTIPKKIGFEVLGDTDCLDYGLPKWSQMLVTGSSVTVDQAMEIIRRTDTFITSYASGNNRRYVEEAKKILRIEDSIDYKGEDMFKYFESQNERRKKWGCIETEFVHNSWISSSYVFGTYGWCHPSGKIHYMDNVGKHPSVESLYVEWSKIAKEFPFLNMGVTLMSGEYGDDDKEPVVSFRITDGKVHLYDPRFHDVHKDSNFESEMNKANQMDSERWANFDFHFGQGRKENYFDLDVLREWAKQVYGE